MQHLPLLLDKDAAFYATVAPLGALVIISGMRLEFRKAFAAENAFAFLANLGVFYDVFAAGAEEFLLVFRRDA